MQSLLLPKVTFQKHSTCAVGEIGRLFTVPWDTAFCGSSPMVGCRTPSSGQRARHSPHLPGCQKQSCHSQVGRAGGSCTGHWTLYPKYIKNPCNSTLKRQTAQLKKDQRIISSGTQMVMTHKKTLDTTSNREMRVTTSETNCTPMGQLHSNRRQWQGLARTWRNQSPQHAVGDVQRAVSL